MTYTTDTTIIGPSKGDPAAIIAWLCCPFQVGQMYRHMLGLCHWLQMVRVYTTRVQTFVVQNQIRIEISVPSRVRNTMCELMPTRQPNSPMSGGHGFRAYPVPTSGDRVDFIERIEVSKGVVSTKESTRVPRDIPVLGLRCHRDMGGMTTPTLAQSRRVGRDEVLVESLICGFTRDGAKLGFGNAAWLNRVAVPAILTMVRWGRLGLHAMSFHRVSRLGLLQAAPGHLASAQVYQKPYQINSFGGVLCTA